MCVFKENVDIYLIFKNKFMIWSNNIFNERIFFFINIFKIF